MTNKELIRFAESLRNYYTVVDLKANVDKASEIILQLVEERQRLLDAYKRLLSKEDGNY
ncbi:MAG TPA: hypothetical protein PLQ34_07755 [Ferrovaceae bacterium]|jgi:predicted CopG family antitoxin|nr:hypothetical protein [Ferrovaceae bacterium]